MSLAKRPTLFFNHRSKCRSSEEIRVAKIGRSNSDVVAVASLYRWDSRGTDVVEPEVKTLLTASQEGEDLLRLRLDGLVPIVFDQCMSRQSFTEKIRHGDTHREVLSIDWQDWDHWQVRLTWSMRIHVMQVFIMGQQMS